MSSNTVELESLLFGPYLWPTSQYWKFYKDVSDLVNKVNKDLKGSLDKESEQIFGTSDFVEMMGVRYWSIFNLDDKGDKRYIKDELEPENADKKKKYLARLLKLKKSLALLLRLIRDKCEHINEYDDDIKEQLNNLDVNGKQFKFFRKAEKDGKGGKYVLNEHQYIAFWNFVFPKSVPFLWLKFHKELPKYNDDKINISYLRETKLDLAKYVEGLRSALDCDMENGNVFRRLKGQGECSLEFRGFHKLNKVIRGNEVVTMAVNPNVNVLMSVSHSSSTDEVMEYIGNAPGTEKLILIFAANITDDEVWENCKSVDCRVVIFCDPDRLTTENIEKAVAKFKTENSLTFELSDSPIMGSELSIDKQNWVFEHGQVLVQGREINIKDIFSNSRSMSGILSGNLLNTLLKNEKPTLFGNYVYPEYKGVYIERKLYLNPNENDHKLEHIYVAVNWDRIDSLRFISESSYFKSGNSQVFNNIQHLEAEIDNVRSDCEFILFKEHKEISDEIIKKCDNALSSRIVRFLDYKCSSVDETNSRIAKLARRDKESRRQLSETEFLKIIRRKNTKTFFFRAESGMGKSKLLISLGTQLRKENSLPIFCTCRNLVDILKQNMGISECTKSDVKSAIQDILRCKDECERKVIDYWLDREGGTGTKVELQLDALDEVPSKNLELALKSLKIIENDFGDSVRLLITSSRPFPSEMEAIKCVEWNISPFSRDDKIAFFLESWTAKGPNKHWCKYSVEKAVRLHFSSTNMTDYPLFCGMIAELFEDNCIAYNELKKPFFKHFLYDSLSKKKFALMMNKRKGVELNNTDKLLQDSYMQVHKYFALVHLFPELSNQFTKPEAMNRLTEEDICKMRIMTGIEPPAFVHLSYAHFFVALFIIDVIETGKLYSLCSNDTFDKFLLSGTPGESNLNIILPLWERVATYLKDWNSFKWLERYNSETHCNVGYNSAFLNFAIKSHLWHLASLLIDVHKSKMDSVEECTKILQLAISEKAPSNWVIEICEQLHFDNQNKLVICSVRSGQYEIAKYLISSWCGDKVFDEIAEMMEGRGGIFHCIADRIFEQYHKFGQNFLEETKEFILFVQEKNPEEIKRRDNRGETLLLALPLLTSKSVFSSKIGFESEELLLLKEFLVEKLNADVNATSFDGESILSFRRDLKKVSYFEKRLSLWKYATPYHETLAFVASKKFAHINLKSKISGLTPLGEAVQYFGPLLGKPTLELFRVLGADFNELDEDGNTILHYSVNWYGIEFIKLLVEHGSKIDVQNREDLCALCLAEKEKKVEMGFFFRRELKLRQDESCRSTCVSKNQTA